MLATEGITTKKYQAARAKSSEFFVKTGRFDVQASKIAGSSLAARQSADYNMETFLSEAEAQLLLDDSRPFYDQTIVYFAQNPVS
ncbi:hypothetical protein GCM10027185_10980 [Spirosoma pulveris]